MGRWFRFYADAMRNPKVLRLSDKDFRLWVNLLAVASENDGKIAPAADLKLVLAMRLDHLQGGLDRLIRGGLIDVLAVGYEPHSWSKFQYKSDVSTERVHKHRAKRNVSETPPDTEAETEGSVAKATALIVDDPDKVFWDSAKRFLGTSKAPLIGKWRGQYGQEATGQAITAAQLARAVDPVSYIEGILRASRKAEVAIGI